MILPDLDLYTYYTPQDIEESRARLAWLLQTAVSPEDLSGKLKGFGFPFIRLPDIDVKLRGPDIKGPDIKGPDIEGPKVKLPEVSFPALGELSKINLPNLPTLPTPQLPSLSSPLPSVSLPQVSLPQVNLPTLSSPSLPQINLPSVNLPQVNLPTLPLTSLPQVNLPSVSLPLPSLSESLGDYAKVPSAVAPAVKVGLGKIEFNPSLQQQLEIGKAVSEGLSKSTITPIAEVGKTVGNVLSPISQGLETITNIAGQVAPWVTAYNIISNIYEGWRNYLLPDRSEEIKQLHQRENLDYMKKQSDYVGRVIDIYNKVVNFSPEALKTAFEIAEKNKGLFGGTAMQIELINRIPKLKELFNKDFFHLADIMTDIEILTSFVSKPTISVRYQYALTDSDKKLLEELNNSSSQIAEQIRKSVGYLTPEERKQEAEKRSSVVSELREKVLEGDKEAIKEINKLQVAPTSREEAIQRGFSGYIDPQRGWVNV